MYYAVLAALGLVIDILFSWLWTNAVIELSQIFYFSDSELIQSLNFSN